MTNLDEIIDLCKQIECKDCPFRGAKYIGGEYECRVLGTQYSHLSEEYVEEKMPAMRKAVGDLAIDVLNHMHKTCKARGGRTAKACKTCPYERACDMLTSVPDAKDVRSRKDW